MYEPTQPWNKIKNNDLSLNTSEEQIKGNYCYLPCAIKYLYAVDNERARANIKNTANNKRHRPYFSIHYSLAGTE